MDVSLNFDRFAGFVHHKGHQMDMFFCKLPYAQNKEKFNKATEKKEVMGGLFDTSSRLPSVPGPIKEVFKNIVSTKAWTSQTKRVKRCSSSIELLYKI